MASLSKPQILMEYARIMEDPVYAIETYMQTFDMTQSGYVPFKLFAGQKKLIKNYLTNRFNLCLKYRQAGISTVTAAYGAVRIAFANPEMPERILILANKLETASEFLNKIKTFIKQLPAWAGVGFEKDSSKHCRITNSEGQVIGEIKAVGTSKDALRGYTPTLLILDEAAFIEGGQELWSACLASIGTGGKAILISTPNGLDEIYHAAYEGAILGKNSFCVTDLKWWQDPRYRKRLAMVKCKSILEWLQTPLSERRDEVMEGAEAFTKETMDTLIQAGWKPYSPWYEEMCRQMNFNQRMINQELETAFIGSGDNVIDSETLRKQEVENVMAPEIKDAAWEHAMWIWKQPVEGHRYIAAFDPSRGDSEDATGYCIIDFDTWEQVAEYHGKISPDIGAELINVYSRMYNALTTVDLTGGMGVAVTLRLKHLNFPTKLLHYDIDGDDGTAQLYGVEDTQQAGINFASRNRRTLIVQALEEGVRTGFKVRSERWCAEAKKFVYKNGKPDHMAGSHDDLLMAMGMCLYVANTAFKKLLATEKATRAMLESWKVNNVSTVANPLNERLKEVMSTRPEPNKVYSYDEFQMKHGNSNNLQNTKDFSWLFGTFKKRQVINGK
jgi:hypothetical protein